MSSILSSQSMVLATAMALSGTVILLALRLQKSPFVSRSIPPSCILSQVDDDEKKKEKEKKKNKKKVHFAEDVVDPTGNNDLYRKKLQNGNNNNNNCCESVKKTRVKRLGTRKVMKEMPENRVALYNGILRDRVFHRVAYSC